MTSGNSRDLAGGDTAKCEMMRNVQFGMWNVECKMLNLLYRMKHVEYEMCVAGQRAENTKFNKLIQRMY